MPEGMHFFQENVPKRDQRHPWLTKTFMGARDEGTKVPRGAKLLRGQKNSTKGQENPEFACYWLALVVTSQGSSIITMRLSLVLCIFRDIKRHSKAEIIGGPNNWNYSFEQKSQEKALCQRSHINVVSPKLLPN